MFRVEFVGEQPKERSVMNCSPARNVNRHGDRE